MTGAPGLVLIDIQTGFDAPELGARNNPGAEALAGRLLAAWRERGWPVFHVRHLSLEPGSPLTAARGGIDFKPEVLPQAGEAVVEKSVNSAFIGTDLEARLRSAGVAEVVIAGLTTPHCVSTSARMAANLGFRVTVVHDACAAFAVNADMGWLPGAPALDAETAHRTALAHLHGEFAQVVEAGTYLAGDA
jgi:nicotinamidase-related amidase